MSELDLGSGVTLRFVSWAPDRAFNPQYEGVPDVEKYGANVEHDKPGGVRCTGYVTFDSPTARKIEPPGRAMWKVESWDPLTLSPSVHCACGFHGYIRSGRWVSV